MNIAQKKAETGCTTYFAIIITKNHGHVKDNTGNTVKIQISGSAEQTGLGSLWP
jgi:hypothetical protein